MSISNYMPSQVCGYKFSKLKDVVYLFTEENIKNIHIDNGEAYITDMSETLKKVKCFNVEFTEQESLDERYKFTKTLKFSVNGYANIKSLEGGLYAIIMTTEGVPYVVNVDFPSKVTFIYNLSERQNATEFTFTSQSNYPTLKLNGSLGEYPTICNKYADYGVLDIALIEKDYVSLNDTDKTLTLFGGRTFKTVEWLKDSCTFSETFDGEVVTDTITFDIALDDYKPSWQYNLLEFKDNLYTAMVSPRCDTNQYFVGFNFGLEPSYSIQSTTEAGNTNKITVTFTEKSVHGMYALTDIIIISNTDRIWRYTDEVLGYDTYECIDNNYAIYLAQEELDSQSNPTGHYKVYSKYYDRYKDLFNVIDTFDERIVFFTTKCSWFGKCTLITDMPDLITFAGTVCKRFNFKSTCDWYFEDMPEYLTFSVTSGLANTNYSIEICNELETDVTITTSFYAVTGVQRIPIGVQILNGEVKYRGFYNDSKIYTIQCDGENSTLTQAEVSAYTKSTRDKLVDAYIGTCVETVGNYSFYTAYPNLREFTMSDSVKYIGYAAFYQCYGLQDINLPNSILSIGDYAFSYCNTATSVRLGSNLQTIGNNAFKYCSSLLSVEIPSSLQNWGGASFAACLSLSSVTINQSSVTAIPSNTFEQCISLRSVTLPNNITNIGGYAFNNCHSLSSATLSNTLETISTYVFGNCYNLTSISFPNTLRTIDNGAFQGCSGLTTLTIPSGVTTIGNSAFYDCSSLTGVWCHPLTPPTIGTNAFYNTNNCPIYVHCEVIADYKRQWYQYRDRIVPMENNCPEKMIASNGSVTKTVYCDGNTALTASEVDDLGFNHSIVSTEIYSCDGNVTEVGSGTYDGETHLTSVTFANSITEISSSAFKGCTSLPSINFPSGLEIIGSQAFANCTTLDGVTFPSSLTAIDSEAFLSDTAIKSISIPNSVTIIGTGAFENNVAMTALTIGNGITTIPNSCFRDCHSLPSVTIPNVVTKIGNRSFETCSGLTSVTLSSGLTSIGDSAFKKCTSLRNVVIPDEVNVISASCFAECTSLSAITLSSDYCNTNGNLTSLGNAAFSGDSALRELRIPATVTSMGNNLCKDCSNLDAIYVYSEIPPTLGGADAFTNTNNCPIYVPCCSIADYKRANGWNDNSLKYRLKGYDFSLEGCTGSCTGGCPSKLDATYTSNRTYSVFCDGSNVVSTDDTMLSAPYSHLDMTDATVYTDCASGISTNSFSGFTNLSAYTISGDDLVSIGDNAFSDCPNLTSAVVPNSVTQLGSAVFQNDTSLVSATLPSGLTTITDYLFDNCTSLPSISLPSETRTISNYAFHNNTSLTGVTFPTTLTTIGSNTFQDCTSFTSVTIPSGVTGIGNYAFEGDTALTAVYCDPLRPPTLGRFAFDDTNDCDIYVHCCCLGAYQKDSSWRNYKDRLKPFPNEVPCEPKLEVDYLYESSLKLYCSDCNSSTGETVTQNEVRSQIIEGESGYRPYSSITEVTVGGCATMIGNNAFEDCIGMTSATLSNSVTTIAQNGFGNCNSLESIVLGNSLEVIRENAFSGCTSLNTITLPNSLTTIARSAFEHCGSLGSAFSIPDSVSILGEAAFKDCQFISSVNIPSGLTFISNEVFENCLNLTSVTFSDGAVSIGVDAFRFCKNLGDVTIPSGVTSIGNRAFEGCESFTRIDIPSGVTSIGEQAFYNCTGVTDVWVYSQVPPSLSGESVFDNLGLSGGWTLHVPCLDAYTGATKWSEYAGHMVQYGSGCNIAFYAKYSNYAEKKIMCEGLATPNTLSSNEVRNGSTPYNMMTEATIGECINSIGMSAFWGCSGLTSITVEPTTPPLLGSAAFDYTNNCPIYVPCESYEAYMAASRWGNTYGDRITRIPVDTRWVDDGYMCVGDKQYVRQLKQGTCDNTTWYSMGEYRADMSRMIGDCVRMFYAEYSNGTSYSADCEGSSVLTRNATSPSGYSTTQMTYAQIGDCITSIGESCFDDFDSLSSVTIPNSVTSIGDGAFEGCDSLSSITIPSGVTTIGDFAFNACIALSSVTIPSAITTIGNHAFWQCSNLQSITVNAATPPTLGTNVFDNTNNCPISVPCSSYDAYVAASGWSTYASRITRTPTFTQWVASGTTCVNNQKYTKIIEQGSCDRVTWWNTGNWSTSGSPQGSCGKLFATYSDGKTYSAQCSSTSTLTSGDTHPSGYQYSAMISAEIGDCVTSIAERPFYNCTWLGSVIISDSVTSIGNYAFKWCRNLSSLSIGDGMTSIGMGAFDGCYGLSNVIIPSGVTTIGNQAFQNCTGLTSVTVEATTPPTLGGTSVFDNTNNCPIYVPSASVSTYQSTIRWSEYASRIQAIP